MPKISVIIPTYIRDLVNREFLRQAIESVKNQSYKDFEIIIIDDASPIDIRDLCIQSAANYEIENSGHLDIVYFRNDENLGIGATRQKGIELSKGNWITFCSADDLLPEDALKKHMEAAEKNPDAVQYSNYVNIDDKGRQISVFFAPYHSDKQQLILEAYAWAFRGDMFCCFSTLFAPRRCFETLPIQPLRMSEDLAWWIQAVKQFPFIHIEKPLCYYRRHAGQVTSQRTAEELKRTAEDIIKKFI